MSRAVGDLEYDIGVGLRFDFHQSEHTADEVRRWIYEAVEDHTRRIEKKNPCLRLAYEAG